MVLNIYHYISISCNNISNNVMVNGQYRYTWFDHRNSNCFVSYKKSLEDEVEINYCK